MGKCVNDDHVYNLLVVVMYRHMMSVACRFERKPASVQSVIECLEKFRPQAVKLGLYSAPEAAIRVFSDDCYHPQPRLDLMTGRGFTVCVGRVRTGDVFDLQFTLLSHNTILGAAGSSILNAEIALQQGLI